MNIDHLVWFAPDLAAAEHHFAELMGAAPTFGGVHSGEGTCNSLLSLGDATYLEILARDPAQPASNRTGELRHMAIEGLYHWAMAGVDLADVVARGRRAGPLLAPSTKADAAFQTGAGWAGACLASPTILMEGSCHSSSTGAGAVTLPEPRRAAAP
jgi:hypothetical protein